MSATAARFGAAFSFALALAAAPGLVRAAADEIEAHVERQGEFIVCDASVLMQVDPRIAWDVLSDYNGLARFIPDMKSSRVVSRDGNRVLVEQKGAFGFFFYRQAVDVTLEVLEQPPLRIDAHRIAGNIKALETRYELGVSDAGVKLTYTGRFIPDFSVPPLFGMPMVRRIVERRFRAMAEEIERRDALVRSAPKP
ncbi:MAG TPA: SRPBCC family protein [Burkholderiales bacterium]|nr:SRPBCC family protein [Burkholderiales bacterium]